jgi:hypothetical protein
VEEQVTKRFTFKVVKVGEREYLQIVDEHGKGVLFHPPELLLTMMRKTDGLTVEWNDNDGV